MESDSTVEMVTIFVEMVSVAMNAMMQNGKSVQLSLFHMETLTVLLHLKFSLACTDKRPLSTQDCPSLNSLKDPLEHSEETGR